MLKLEHPCHETVAAVVQATFMKISQQVDRGEFSPVKVKEFCGWDNNEYVHEDYRMLHGSVGRGWEKVFVVNSTNTRWCIAEFKNGCWQTDDVCLWTKHWDLELFGQIILTDYFEDSVSREVREAKCK